MADNERIQAIRRFATINPCGCRYSTKAVEHITFLLDQVEQRDQTIQFLEESRDKYTEKAVVADTYRQLFEDTKAELRKEDEDLAEAIENCKAFERLWLESKREIERLRKALEKIADLDGVDYHYGPTPDELAQQALAKVREGSEE